MNTVALHAPTPALSPASAETASSTSAISPADRDALRFDLFSQPVLFTPDEAAAYHALGRELEAAYAPQTADQRSAVRTLQNTHWRLNRIFALECNLLALGTRQRLEEIRDSPGNPLDEIACRALAQASGYLANARIFDQIGKQEGRLRRLLAAVTAQLALMQSGPPPAHDSRLQPRPGQSPSLPARSVPEPHRPIGEQMPHFTGPMADLKRKQWRWRKERAASAAASLNAAAQSVSVPTGSGY